MVATTENNRKLDEEKFLFFAFNAKKCLRLKYNILYVVRLSVGGPSCLRGFSF